MNIEQIMLQSHEAFQHYGKISKASRASFLRAIADSIDNLGDVLIETAVAETHLPDARIRNERGRTTNQLKSFAALLDAGDWVQASIDTGDPERKPAAKPGLRKMLFPVGPVVVFGASNFPLAFSTAGGDTASALAAGCPVIVKGHPAHPRTASLVSQAVQRAVQACKMPEHIFQYIDDTSLAIGQQLVKHPLTKAVAFTGSYQGGKALFDLACQRPEPIPVFAEMGSINPVVVFPEAVRQHKELPEKIASSILLGVGQFCTNPGLIIVLESEDLQLFLDALSHHIATSKPGSMLHEGIALGYRDRKNKSLSQQGVSAVAQVAAPPGGQNVGAPVLASVKAVDFIQNDILREEVFGPYSLVVRCSDHDELVQVVLSLQGQLTSSLFGTSDELKEYAHVVEALKQRCGRLIYNGVPTGVEVCKAMHHGGPFPATTDSRFTSVGTDAIYRFVRPVSFQDFPDEMLPHELQDHNPFHILRCIDGQWTREAIGSMMISNR